jgi:short-subunit dehydrogenase
MNEQMKKAIIVGASSGIGRDLAKILAGKGYAVGLIARREALLRNIQGELPSKAYIKAIDICNRDDTQKGLTGLITEMGGADLVIISTGIGFINPELDLDKELETVATNVQGFVTVANVAFRHFVRQGAGHLVGISSIAAIRGGAEAPAYNASKAFISNYLQGLRQKAAKSKLAITVTDIQPGFVDTDMAKGEGIFWMAPVQKAAAQIYRAIERKRPHAFVTKRWRLVAWMLKIMPDFLYHRI